QPVAWWLADHVEEGKQHLNFSEFKTYKAEKAAHKLEEVVEEVAGGEMPLKSYTLIHRDAIVTTEELNLLRNWVASKGIEVGGEH
ncbi:MAG: heme-binding domain-containing protein, partial [Cyclobacteriaceae bacterium]|nr:heme-binding domain-containing protein [Cyclobacteriaceae bacterium]